MTTLMMAMTTTSAQKPSAPAKADYVHVPTITDLFARAPRSVFPLLERNTRLDMIDYHNSGLATASRNLMGGESRIVDATDRTLQLSMTPASSYKMTLLEARGDTVIALVRTLLLPTPDSDITLYTTHWQPTPADAFTPPSLDQWLTAGIKGTDPDVVNLLPFVTATIDIDGNTMTLRPSLERRYTADDSTKVAAALRPSMVYTWDGRRFKLQK
jgi:hypothetical protein